MLVSTLSPDDVQMKAQSHAFSESVVPRLPTSGGNIIHTMDHKLGAVLATFSAVCETEEHHARIPKPIECCVDASDYINHRLGLIQKEIDGNKFALEV